MIDFFLSVDAENELAGGSLTMIFFPLQGILTLKRGGIGRGSIIAGCRSGIIFF
jgi:hypothetical protein